MADARVVAELAMLGVAVGITLHGVAQTALRRVLGERVDTLATWNMLFSVDGLVVQLARVLEVADPGSAGAARAEQIRFGGLMFLTGLVTVFGASYERRLHLTRSERGIVALGWAGVILVLTAQAVAPRVMTDWLGLLMVASTAMLLAASTGALSAVMGHVSTPRAERLLVAVPLGLLAMAAMVDVLGAVPVTLLPLGYPVYALATATASQMRLSRAERLLAVRTDTLAERNRSLDAALAESRAARETRARFIANVSHELRTPVHGMLGLSSLLSDTPLDPRQRELVAHLTSSARAMKGLVDDVLDFARIDAGRAPSASAWVDPRDVVSEVLATLAHAAYQKMVGIEARVEVDVPAEVLLDPMRTRQILLNLVGNAVKFTDDGSVTVAVKVASPSPGLIDLVFEVCDTGPGIDPSRLEVLFEPFEQGDTSNTRVYGGSGLGLSISRELVLAMGGAIEVESEVGRGSTFRVLVPAGVRDDAPPWRLPLTVGARVLVLDWDGLLRFALEPMLAAAGAATTWRRSVSEVGVDERFEVIIDGTLALPHEVAALRQRCGARWLAAPRLDDRPEWPRGAMPDAVLYRPVFPSRLAEVLAMPGLGDFDPPTMEQQAEQRPVLVVDDNPVNLLVACRLVERFGHPVIAARGGVEALAVLEHTEVDTVLMDCQMPEMDGFEATRRIRARWGQRPRIIALTASALDTDRTRALQCGMDGYLVKPVAFERLREVLGSRRATGPQGSQVGTAL